MAEEPIKERTFPSAKREKGNLQRRPTPQEIDDIERQKREQIDEEKPPDGEKTGVQL
jgi:hypothetical protein